MEKLCFIAIVGVFLSLLIKEKSPNISLIISIACGVLILISITDDISEIFSFADGIFTEDFDGGELFSLLMKLTGLAYIIDFSADICRDAGENGTAKKLEFAGKITMIALSLPIISELFEKIKDVFT